MKHEIKIWIKDDSPAWIKLMEHASKMREKSVGRKVKNRHAVIDRLKTNLKCFGDDIS